MVAANYQTCFDYKFRPTNGWYTQSDSSGKSLRTLYPSPNSQTQYTQAWLTKVHIQSQSITVRNMLQTIACVVVCVSKAHVRVFFHSFLLRDATQSAVMRLHVVCLSVRLSVTFRYRDHIGWNTSKIISQPNSLGPLLWLTPTWAIWCNGNTPKIMVE